VPLIVFDLDGTLVDSRQDLAFAVNRTLAELGARPLPEPEVTGMVGEGARLLVDRALASAGVPPGEAPRALERFLEVYDEHLLDHTRAYDGIGGLLERVHGLARLAVLTNKPTRASRRVLAGLGIESYFTRVIGGDNEFGRKPDPRALLHLVETAEADRRQTLLVGDSRIDLETARNAAVPCCLVRWGFGFPPDGVAPEIPTADVPATVAEIFETLLRRGQ
jgi:phosphoglycolate phosphatase